jgi:predicted outer membrane lipoprotein
VQLINLFRKNSYINFSTLPIYWLFTALLFVKTDILIPPHRNLLSTPPVTNTATPTVTSTRTPTPTVTSTSIPTPIPLPMQERTKIAFDFAYRTTAQLITLATGIITLSITFLKDFLSKINVKRRTRTQVIVIFSWVLLLMSVCFGILTDLTLTGNMGNIKAAPDVYASNTRMVAILQIITFLMGLLLTIVFGVMVLQHWYRQKSEEEQKTATIIIDDHGTTKEINVN